MLVHKESMNSLLEYALYQFTWFILSSEIFILIFACLSIVFIKAFTNWKTDKNKRAQEEISLIIEGSLFQGQPIYIPTKYSSFRNIVEVLERFDQRLADDRWQEIKKTIVQTYLTPRVRKMASSYNWASRQLAARCYYLQPELADENMIRILFHDSKYLVRVIAAVTVVQLDNKELFYEMIEQMSKEYIVSRFAYRDALIEASPEKFLWLEQLLEKDPPTEIASICLDILSNRLSHNMLPVIKNYIGRPNQQCRLLAITALGSIPSAESVQILKEHLSDSDWEIRAESIKSIARLHITDATDKLNELLSDPIWWVRLQAALTLRSFGKKGEKILMEQPASSADSYEIANYVLSLPESTFFPSFNLLS